MEEGEEVEGEASSSLPRYSALDAGAIHEEGNGGVPRMPGSRAV